MASLWVSLARARWFLAFFSWRVCGSIACFAAFTHLPACTPAPLPELLEGDHRILLELVRPHPLGHGSNEAEVVVPVPWDSRRTIHVVGAGKPARPTDEHVSGGECRAYLRIRGYARGAGRRPSRILILDSDGTRLVKRFLVDDAQNDLTFFIGRVDEAVRLTALFRLRRPFAAVRMEVIFVHVPNKTRAFLEELDASRYERQGSDFGNPRYAHGNLLARPDVNRIYSYDFDLVRTVERRLLGVDRRTALAHLFAQIVGGAEDPTQQHLAVLRFLHKSSFHHSVQPMYPDRTTVNDPLVLLELGDVRCGHINRVGVDLFDALGVPGRIVQLGHHQAAEIHYGGRWHYLDGDIFGNGEAPRKADGTIPSIVELSETPRAIDSLTHYHELNFGANAIHGSRFYPSWYFFSRAAYESSQVPPSYYVKTAVEGRLLDRGYGWLQYETVPDSDRRLYEMDKKWAPGAVRFSRAAVRQRSREAHQVQISWEPAADRDEDLVGYRVFVATKPRGWCYQEFAGADDIRRYWSDCGGWKPEMYERMFRQPPHDIDLVTTTQPQVALSLPSGRTYFVTVMPFDAHGESVGKQIYAMSAELRFEL